MTTTKVGLRAIIAAALLTAAAAAAQNISIKYENGDFRVTGWTTPIPDPEGVFSVYVGTGNSAPLNGSYSAGRGLLVFHPRFPLAPGVHYRAVFQLAGEPKVEAFFDGPPQDTTPTTRIENIYPSASVLPANQLKIYLYFSASMAQGDASTHVHLLDEAHQPVSLAFLDSGQEVWDADYRRLTIYFDPGHTRPAPVSDQEVGPALIEGRKYTLRIDKGWLDARGLPLVDGVDKVFLVGPPERSSPDPSQWRITVPKAGTSDPLVVDFPKSLDYALLQRALSVAGVAGALTGVNVIDREETEWRFTPQEAWKAGSYKLVAGAALEDLAGNRLDRLFDGETQNDLQPDTHDAEADRVTAAAAVTLPFEIRQP